MYSTYDAFHKIFIDGLDKIDELLLQMRLEADKWEKEGDKLTVERNESYYTGMIFGGINAYCYMVSRGCKPVAETALQNRHLKEVREIVEKASLYFYSEFLYEGWSTIYIYKHSHMLEIIKNTLHEPKTIYEH